VEGLVGGEAAVHACGGGVGFRVVGEEVGGEVSERLEVREVEGVLGRFSLL